MLESYFSVSLAVPPFLAVLNQVGSSVFGAMGNKDSRSWGERDSEERVEKPSARANGPAARACHLP